MNGDLEKRLAALQQASEETLAKLVDATLQENEAVIQVKNLGGVVPYRREGTRAVVDVRKIPQKEKALGRLLNGEIKPLAVHEVQKLLAAWQHLRCCTKALTKARRRDEKTWMRCCSVQRQVDLIVPKERETTDSDLAFRLFGLSTKPQYVPKHAAQIETSEGIWTQN